MKLIYYGTVQDGRLHLSHRKQFDIDLKQYEGKRVEIVLTKANKRKSNEQNKFLWGCVYPCALQGFVDAGHDGLTIDDMHEYFKSQFLTAGKDITNPRTGEIRTVSKTTTILSTTEMMNYVEQIARFCAEMLNVVIPEPMPILNYGT